MLSGNALDTDANNTGGKDIVHVTNATNGTHYLAVIDTNANIPQNVKSLVAIDDSKNTTFVGKEYNSGGLYIYNPTIEQGTTGDEQNWYLTNLERTINPDTAVLLYATDNSYALWRNTNDSMNDRLGELHNINTKTGAWARFIDGRFSGNGYDGDYNTVQVGFDKAVTDKTILGIALDRGNSESTYTDGKEEADFLALSLYSIWAGNYNDYLHFVARAGKFDSELRSKGDFPDSADYKNKAYSISAEYGKRFSLPYDSFVELQTQFTLGHISRLIILQNAAPTAILTA